MKYKSNYFIVCQKRRVNFRSWQFPHPKKTETRALSSRVKKLWKRKCQKTTKSLCVHKRKTNKTWDKLYTGIKRNLETTTSTQTTLYLSKTEVAVKTKRKCKVLTILTILQFTALKMCRFSYLWNTKNSYKSLATMTKSSVLGIMRGDTQLLF